MRRRVLTTISDKKNAVASSTDGSLIGYFNPDIISGQDYYPFGMVMRVQPASNGKFYKYGFNGKEQDDEVKGWGNEQDYGMRIYDTRLGRFLSVDPLTQSYPELTPYQFASNRPIDGADLDGKEWDLKTIPRQLGETQIQMDQSYRSTYLSWQNPSEQHILKADMYSNGVMGKRRNVERIIAARRQEYNVALGEAISSGPFASFAFLKWGDKGAFVGASFDGIAMSFAGLPGEGYSTRPNEPTIEAKPPTTEQVFAAHNGNVEAPSEFVMGRQRVSPPTLQQKNSASKPSEAIVRSKLLNNLKNDEILLSKVRFYIVKDGEETYSVPDFAIYNTKTNQFTGIYDAKNGNGELTPNQRILNKNGGEFRGSSRFPEALPQSVAPGLVTKEKTNVSYSTTVPLQ